MIGRCKWCLELCHDDKCDCSATARIAALEAEVEKLRVIGWAQELSDGRLCLMETTLPKDEIHDNGRPMYQLLIRPIDAARKEADRG